MKETPLLVGTHIPAKILFVEFGIENITIIFVFVIGCGFVRTIKTPNESIIIATQVKMQVTLAVVGQVRPLDISLYMPFRRRLDRNDIYYACQRVAAISQRCGSLKHFNFRYIEL